MVNPFAPKTLNLTLIKYTLSGSTTSAKCTTDKILIYNKAVKCKAVTPLNNADIKKLCINNRKEK